MWISEKVNGRVKITANAPVSHSHVTPQDDVCTCPTNNI